MKISIITVCFNAEALIEQTLRSVVDQNFTSKQYLIIDGNSTDSTLEIVSQYREAIDQIVSEPDGGIYDAMNKGLSLATGEYVLFLNAGDQLFSNQTLETLFALDDADIYYGETTLINDKQEVLGTRSELTTRPLPRNLNVRSFLNGQPVSHQSFIVRRELIGNFDLQFQCSADIDWMIRAVRNAKIIRNSGITISRYLLGGTSDRKLKKCWIERARILLRYFNPMLVLLAHFKFALRYLRHGAYKH